MHRVNSGVIQMLLCVNIRKPAFSLLLRNIKKVYSKAEQYAKM